MGRAKLRKEFRMGDTNAMGWMDALLSLGMKDWYTVSSPYEVKHKLLSVSRGRLKLCVHYAVCLISHSVISKTVVVTSS